MSLVLEPIGFVRNDSKLKFETRHQPEDDSGETNLIVLNEGQQFELALQDLATFERIWLIWWFDRNKTWRPRVLPPRGPAVRRGVFATRSPHRPNPIGITSARLLQVEGLNLTVGPLDLVDGTPILDIKPYLRTADAFPEANMGWVDDVEAAIASGPRFEIQVSPLAQTQLDWLRDQWQIDFTQRAFEMLSQDPTPHRTRRILRLKDGRGRLACGPWRVYFWVQDQTVLVESIGVGCAPELLARRFKVIDRDAQLAFLAMPGWQISSQ
ncbi:MAG: tRNA (N6-threonylcarbamoyladenosine(37)-N6)-methyltransferase TrmO [Fimbriimonas sp.]